MTDEDDVEEKRPSVWLWPFLLFYKPRTFYRAVAATQTPGLTAVSAWMYGIAAVIDRTAQNFSRGRDVAWVDSWEAYWAVVLMMGAFGGFLFWGIGGWWYRLRIRWSGVRSPNARLAKRVYLFASQIHVLPTVAMMVLASSSYDTPIRSIQSGGSVWDMVLLIFPFWSVASSYVGVRTLFPVRRGAAITWFLVLPSVVYALAIAAVFAALFLLDTEPDLDRPQVYQGSTMELSYPGNWWWNLEETPEGVEGVFFEGTPDAYVRVMTYESQATSADELDFSLESFRALEQWTPGESFDSWGRFRGAGRSGTFVQGGVSYRTWIFVAGENEKRFLECQAIFIADEADRILPVVDLVGITMKLK